MRKVQSGAGRAETRYVAGMNLLGAADDGTDSYSSSSTFSDSYSDSSDLANWEEFVAEDGTLFYAEYTARMRRSAADANEKSIEFSRNTTWRAAAGGKKSASRRSQPQPAAAPNGQQKQFSQQAAQKTQRAANLEYKFANVKPQDSSSYKYLELVITAADRFRFGRRSTAVESILGFCVQPFADQPECLMVDSFVHDMPAMQQQQQQQAKSSDSLPIKRGDWFRALDDIEVRASNVDELLCQFVQPTKVCLKFVAQSVESTAAANAMDAQTNELKKIENFASFSAQVEHLLNLQENTDLAVSCFALLILPPECYQTDEHKDSLYFYPHNSSSNFLYKARGSFLTLNAVLSEELQTKPSSSKLHLAQGSYHVSYRVLNGLLVLFAYAAQMLTQPEADLRSDEFIGYLRFAFPTLCIDHFAHSNVSSVTLRQFLLDFCEVQRVRLLKRHSSTCLFDELLKESRQMSLPKEAQLRIFDALSEMEAMDYRNWNDEPLNTHREFYIHGSLLYYDGHQLANQLPAELRYNLENFLRCRGIFDFISEQNVKKLYVWQEITLANANGRYFLTICARGHLSLAVVLKMFDAPDLAANAIIAPSLFYIEEIQETLDHLVQCGIESLAMFWSLSNKRPEVMLKLQDAEASESSGSNDRESGRLESFIKQKFAPVANSATSARSFDADTQLCSSLGGSSSVHSLTPSEDDSCKRRHNNQSNNNDESDSGSDWDNFAEQNPLHYVLDAESQTQMTESLWKEINNVVPVKIAAGWKNSVFYYVYVDTANGTVFCPLKANSEAFPFLHEMRKACHLIHRVLQQTKNFRRLLAQESNAASMSTLASSNGAVKEFGITIQVQRQCNAGAAATNSDADTLTTEQAVVVTALKKEQFIVVGRLFLSPAREVYVCHRPDVPQNMVELAFRLSFFSVG